MTKPNGRLDDAGCNAAQGQPKAARHAVQAIATTAQVWFVPLSRRMCPEDWLIVEGRSRTTAENASLFRAMTPDGNGPWILLTSAFHMPRAVGSFCAAGSRNLVPYPTDHCGGTIRDQIGWNLAEDLADLNIWVKEWVELLAYRLTGHTENFLPKELR